MATVVVPKCAAAKGLSGDNLLCVDFTPAQTLDGLRGAGWIISKDMGTGQEQWEITGGVLQVKNFATFASTASFTLPQYDLNTLKSGVYNSITLVLRHKVDLDLGTAIPNQQAQIYFGTANPGLLITETSGTQPEQQISVTIDKGKQPSGLNGVYKFLLQVTSLMGKGTAGWQISSIAINANM